MRLRAISQVTLRVHSLSSAKAYYKAVFGLLCTPALVRESDGLRLEN